MKISDSIVCLLAHLNRFVRRTAEFLAAFSRNMKGTRLSEIRNHKNQRRALTIALAFLIVALLRTPSQGGPSSSKGELTPRSSVSGSPDILSTDNICQHCHTSHSQEEIMLGESQANNVSQTALWNQVNKEASGSVLFDSAADGKNLLPLPSYSSARLCLSCHDGVTAKAPGGGNTAIMRRIMEAISANSDATSLHGDVAPFLLAPAIGVEQINIAKVACFYWGAGGVTQVACSTCHERLCQRWQMSRDARGGDRSCLICHEK